MIEIPEPPDKSACASCDSALSWLYSPKRQGWIAVVRVDDDTMRLHRCKHAQDRGTWRDLRRADPPNAEYVTARSKIKSAPKEATT